MSEKSDYWQLWADHAEDISPLYARLSRAIGGNERLRALAGRAQIGQPHANMILGAVHFLLLRDATHDLSRFYATLGGTTSARDEDPFPPFADFVAQHEARIADLIETRVTNTNEVGRSAILHPGFRMIAADAGAPLNLIEIGPSAGLNLIWDRYGVRYLRDGAVALEYGANAPLMVDADLRGEACPPAGPAPGVARRIGLELNPVDLADADDRDWLRALIWPDMPARLERLDRAISLFRAEGAGVEIHRGDALELLLPALRTIPESERACVFHTIALYQLSRGMQQTVEDLLTVAGLRRPVWRLAYENRSQQIGAVLTLIRYHDGTRQERRLAHGQSHGAWLEWLA